MKLQVCVAAFCHRLGTEHEKLGYHLDDHRRLAYDEIKFLLEQICARYGWTPVMEKDKIVGTWIAYLLPDCITRGEGRVHKADFWSQHGAVKLQDKSYKDFGLSPLILKMSSRCRN